MLVKVKRIKVEPRMIRTKRRGRTEMIPEIWLMRRSQSRQREGLDSYDAYEKAVEDWFAQSTPKDATLNQMECK